MHVLTVGRTGVAPSLPPHNHHHTRHQHLVLSQSRRYFFNSLGKLVNLRKLQDAVDGTTDDAKKLEYIRALVAYSPRTAMQQIERGWESGKLPVNDALLKEYLKCAAELKKLDSVNVAGLMALVQRQGELGAAGTAAGAGAVGGTTGAGIGPLVSLLGAGQRFSAGGTPNEPLYVATQEASWKTQAWRFVRNGLSLFLVLSFVGAIMDERGGGGLSSRMGMGSAVHQAEESDKSFKDVVGIDEAKVSIPLPCTPRPPSFHIPGPAPLRPLCVQPRCNPLSDPTTRNTPILL